MTLVSNVKKLNGYVFHLVPVTGVLLLLGLGCGESGTNNGPPVGPLDNQVKVTVPMFNSRCRTAWR
ncbi:MAG: hypothetical protein GXP49_02965 [Deltaproteobacteria bacterium]|nr:hypothetical protein [Deltaproteobacteria bacterium]